MFEYEESPPPLHHSPSPSDESQSTSRDTTPATPVGSGPSFGKKTDKESLPWFRKPLDVGRTTTSLCLDDSILEPDFDDNTFPTFGASPPARGMASVATPIDISARQTSTSPRGNQPSTLTSALQRSDSEEKRKMATQMPETALNRPIPQMPSNASDDFARFEHGARPITMKGVANDKMRRESIAQSLGTGMSWGGISVGSWIRDDMMMSGTSPFTFNSPSFHSSSYLPKLEANFMKDFSCCGLTLPTLHDLLQHYEEAHAQKDPGHAEANQAAVPDSRAALAATTAAQVQQEAQQRNQQQQQSQNASGRPFGSQSSTSQNMQRPSVSGFSSTLQTIPDMDTVEDMEMDDIDGGSDDKTPPPNLYTQNQSQISPQSSFSRAAQGQIPQLNTSMMQGHQAFRQSTPNTPVSTSRPSTAFQGNNASSTLMGNPMQQFQDLQSGYRGTPDSSAPGTPGELDDGLMSGMDDMSMQGNPLFNGLPNGFGNFGFGMNNDMIDLCIDEPAKRLFSPGNQGMNAGQNGQQSVQSRLGSGQYGPNSEIARTIRERQAAAGLPDTTTNILPHEEPKPFRCPVIGCEKAYKNQNGLKYHKSHGHNNQRLQENGDGTFSIVDPDTQAPYPGTLGMEKEKPYKCEVCQKRYKNLNGLKYHKTHSPPCNPELQLNAGKSPSLGMANMMAAQSAGDMGAGLSGDSSMM
ncbi:Transcriptional regulator of ribosomal biogenesis proteins [Exophiala dermatitidis]|uniref:Transcriptional regulator of ribosomal biogenesis proteins n=1 Tax=Exophiala dermatitidis TaxID=5970 RepID=A0AAN6IVG2_EXODE|nr:Transcriptional regulator of ribosomal biogenesis proteins [Exophiala dermatitidis]KAJ4524388.1 Transcriptional regulator of ribosomal biogenesis proteins [Exophiala dermatitidis]KAJ4525341.1 Transcriptional regulator of ribosomal biogenesis proteins [Exophiala dermatitidis]KAJ4536653.1 Transcriptional regulator of ribosomal biogenesis proteins [Exophiala dermatitidis]KAJ4555745.1 Transcriptional regulator of ribosomal biogenesis proteins [Exophiala dermatitidis]